MINSCQAYREQDQMVCGKCGLQWDIKDKDRPACVVDYIFATGDKDALNLQSSERRYSVVKESNDWIERFDNLKTDEGLYWVVSSYGVVMAWFNTTLGVFYDSENHNEEGDEYEPVKFTVSHYQPIIKPVPPEGT